MTHFFPSPCNRDAESFSNGIFLSLGFSTCWNERVFPGKVTFHPSLSSKPLFLISLGVFLPQSHSFHSLSIEFSLSLSKADFRRSHRICVGFQDHVPHLNFVQFRCPNRALVVCPPLPAPGIRRKLMEKIRKSGINEENEVNEGKRKSDLYFFACRECQ